MTAALASVVTGLAAASLLRRGKCPDPGRHLTMEWTAHLSPPAR